MSLTRLLPLPRLLCIYMVLTKPRNTIYHKKKKKALCAIRAWLEDNKGSVVQMTHWILLFSPNDFLSCVPCTASA